MLERRVKSGGVPFCVLILSVMMYEPALAQPMEQLAKGTLAPDFSVTSLEGERLDSTELKGKVIVLNFWYISCPPCRTEIPRLNRLVDRFRDKGVVFIAFAPDSVEDLRAFLEVNEFKYHVVPDATPIAVEYKVSGAPTHILLDREMRVDTVRFGAITEKQGELDRLIENLL